MPCVTFDLALAIGLFPLQGRGALVLLTKGTVFAVFRKTVEPDRKVIKTEDEVMMEVSQGQETAEGEGPPGIVADAVDETPQQGGGFLPVLSFEVADGDDPPGESLALRRIGVKKPKKKLGAAQLVKNLKKAEAGEGVASGRTGHTLVEEDKAAVDVAESGFVDAAFFVAPCPGGAGQGMPLQSPVRFGRGRRGSPAEGPDGPGHQAGEGIEVADKDLVALAAGFLEAFPFLCPRLSEAFSDGAAEGCPEAVNRFRLKDDDQLSPGFSPQEMIHDLGMEILVPLEGGQHDNV